MWTKVGASGADARDEVNLRPKARGKTQNTSRRSPKLARMSKNAADKSSTKVVTPKQGEP